MNQSLSNTIGNKEWTKANEQALLKLLPEKWTDMHEISVVKIGWNLKLLGVDWRSQEELVTIMVWFEKVGLLQRDNKFVKANRLKGF